MCAGEIGDAYAYARSQARQVGLFACSLGVYFSLLGLSGMPLSRALFLSPILDMEAVILGMMAQAGVDEARLAREGEIEVPFGPALSWDYLCSVRSHPIQRWDAPTSILTGEDDCTIPPVDAFARAHACRSTVMPGAGHYFHTDGELAFLRSWVRL